MSKPSGPKPESGPERDTQAPARYYSRYCQIFVHQSGQIQINGEAPVVRAMIKRLKEAGFIINWDYHSRCG